MSLSFDAAEGAARVPDPKDVPLVSPMPRIPGLDTEEPEFSNEPDLPDDSSPSEEDDEQDVPGEGA